MHVHDGQQRHIQQQIRSSRCTKDTQGQCSAMVCTLLRNYRYIKSDEPRGKCVHDIRQIGRTRNSSQLPASLARVSGFTARELNFCQRSVTTLQCIQTQ